MAEFGQSGLSRAPRAQSVFAHCSASYSCCCSCAMATVLSRALDARMFLAHRESGIEIV